MAVLKRVTVTILSLLLGLGLSLALVMFQSGDSAHPKAIPSQLPLQQGINLSHWLSQSPVGYSQAHLQSWIDQSDFQWLAQMGFDHVRLPVDPEFLQELQPPYRIKPEHFAVLDQALAWAQQSHLGLVLDLHPNAALPLTSDVAVLDGLSQLWSEIAHRYQAQANFLVYELLNEPQVQDPQAWQRIIEQLVEVIREQDQKHSIIISGPNWGGPEDLLKLRPIADQKAIYTFHFYNPMAFTSQGADWIEGLKQIQGLPYPFDPQRFAQVKATTPDPEAQKWLGWYANDQYNVSRLAQDLQPVQQFQNRYRVPVYCGELGVYQRSALPPDRYRWYQDVITLLKQNRIGYALWDYRGGFGLVDREKHQADQNLLRILQLTQGK
ncbi:cellulase family glycosylhydrolase [Thermosynechococcaceae cyanobacterium BACA0444]|uniref:Cellulase family glycosylhydrolase n=1 Tax=Pseudocalidococcus azoricus BACA0444 TaxID=2918990 RepID=A0AAE4JUC3_9CYAN|nr:cellulase family glycosylhydrolase [Pseudocalidococcus azoricus]MDS3859215.1 cellulase family glycosylhydrolase [Pseudocalidococcus azoricus BACA0444]